MSDDAKQIRIGKLDSLGGVLVELGRVYRACRHGDIDDQHAVRLTTILREMRCVLEAGEIERRIDELERRL